MNLWVPMMMFVDTIISLSFDNYQVAFCQTVSSLLVKQFKPDLIIILQCFPLLFSFNKHLHEFFILDTLLFKKVIRSPAIKRCLVVCFFFLIDKPTENILEKGCLRGNSKHTGSIHESPKGKNKKGKHSPALNKNPTNQQS